MKMREQDQQVASGSQRVVDTSPQPKPLVDYPRGAPTEEELATWEKQKVAYAAELEERLRKRRIYLDSLA
jgi:hypothetical protein